MEFFTDQISYARLCLHTHHSSFDACNNFLKVQMVSFKIRPVKNVLASEKIFREERIFWGGTREVCLQRFHFRGIIDRDIFSSRGYPLKLHE